MSGQALLPCAHMKAAPLLQRTASGFWLQMELMDKEENNTWILWTRHVLHVAVQTAEKI